MSDSYQNNENDHNRSKYFHQIETIIRNHSIDDIKKRYSLEELKKFNNELDEILEEKHQENKNLREILQIKKMYCNLYEDTKPKKSKKIKWLVNK